jgi:hypothetical protein
MSDEVRRLIEKADKLPFGNRWEVDSLLSSVSRISEKAGSTLMKDLAEYFGKNEVVLKAGGFECGSCKRVFETQQALVGHGPRRCKESKKVYS